MTIMASAPVPTQCRLDEAATVRLHPMTDHDELVIEHEGIQLRVVSVEQHDARCGVRVATPQGTTPEVLHCHACGLAYPADGAKSTDVSRVRLTTCPSWCSWHVLDDGEGMGMHFSAIASVTPTAGGEAEQDTIEVSVDQDGTADGVVSGSGRVVLGTHGAMTPAEALQLAELLVAAAHLVEPVSWRETERWARTFAADPAADPRHREIVADLLRQVEDDGR